MRRSLRTVALFLVLCGCVESQPEDVPGNVTFVAGLPRTSPDYTAASNVTIDPQGTGATSLDPGGQLATAGTGSPVPPFGAAGVAAPPPVSSAGMGSTAAGTGAGPIDTAGAPAAAGTGVGSAGSGEVGAGPDPMPSDTPGTLTVSITTVAAGGRYRPRNYGAVWIETASGQFVKTIERWAGIHVGDLRRWNQASGGWGFSFFGTTSSPDQVDAVSAATARSHVAHSSTWVGKDVMGTLVPDGQYKVVFELADGTTASGEVMFTKGPMPQTASAPPSSTGYSSFTVTYTP
jgi:hypothetical protein